MFHELRLLRPYLSRYWAYFAGGLVLIVGSLALRTVIPVWFGGAIDDLEGMAEAVELPADPQELRDLLLWKVLFIVVAAVVGGVVRMASRVVLLGVSRKAVHDVRNDLFDHLLELAPSFYTRTQTGHLMSRCVNDVQNVQGLLGPVFMYMVETLCLYVFALGWMWKVDPGLTVIALLPFPIFIELARRQALIIHTRSRDSQKKLGELSARVDESLSGQQVIKTMVLEDFDRERFEARATEYRGLNIEISRARARILPMMVGLGSLSTILVLAVGGPRTMRGEMTLGDLIMMMMFLQMMAHPTGTLGFVISSFQRGTAALGRLREIFDIPPALQDPPHVTEPATDEGSLVVRDLTVRFPDPRDEPHLHESAAELEEVGSQERLVLDGVSFEAPAGTTIGIAGPTGSGKTTLLRVLARQQEVEPGRVFLDGEDLAEQRIDRVRRNVGFVPQETFLFSATLADNVALGEPGASRERIEEAVERARLAPDLPQLKDGLETMLGERGVNLSGGQRQRTALARVMLLQPQVLLLDDTLSAVDTHTADEILEELKTWMKGRTTIIVAHRLTTLRGADQILYLEDGRITERGTHEELMELGGRYQALYQRQERREAREGAGDGVGGATA